MPFKYSGEIFSLLSAVTWAISLSVYKKVGKDIPAALLTFFKNTIAIAAFVLLLSQLGTLNAIDSGSMIKLIASGVLGIGISDSLLFAGLSRMGVFVTSISFCLAPPLTTLLAYLFLGEELSVLKIVGMLVVLLALVGIAYEQKPKKEQIAADHRIWFVGFVFLFLSQMTNALGMVLTRSGMHDANVFVGTLIRLVAGTVSLLPLFFSSYFRGSVKKVFERSRLYLLIVGAVLGTFLGIILMTAGLKFAPAGIANILNSTAPIWALPISYYLFKEKITPRVVLYAVVAFLGIMIILY